MTAPARSKKDPAADSGRPEPAAGRLPLAVMTANARTASRFLKALSNPNRLMLLCLLSEGEQTVSELEAAIGLRQPAVSQQLARLRAEGLVTGRRSGKSIRYRIASDEARQVLQLIDKLFCNPEGDKTAAR